MQYVIIIIIKRLSNAQEEPSCAKKAESGRDILKIYNFSNNK